MIGCPLKLMVKSGAVALFVLLVGCETIDKLTDKFKTGFDQPQKTEEPATPSPEQQPVVQTQRKLKGRIEIIPELEKIDEQYQAIKRSNVRGGPGVDYVITGGLREGEQVYVKGKVKRRNWFAVTKRAGLTDYVHGSLLAPVSRQPEQTTDKRPPVEQAEPAAPAAERLTADRVRAAFSGKSIAIVDESTGLRWAEYYSAENNEFIRDSKGNIYQGQWRVQNVNNKLCRVWLEEGVRKGRCFEVVFDGKRYFLESGASLYSAPKRLKIIKMVTGNRLEILSREPNDN